MTYDLHQIGLTIKTPSSLGSKPVGMVWRRMPPEYSRTDMLPVDRELIMSDVFEFQIFTTDVSDDFILEIPVYSKPDNSEEVYMKTDRSERIGKLKDIKKVKKGQWVCCAKTNPCSMNSFVLVTLPITEKFPVTAAGGTFSSNMAAVDIFVKPETFKKRGHLNFEVIPKPPLEEDRFDNVLSLSNFFDISHSAGEQPNKEMIMTVPLPDNFKAKGDLYVMACHEQVESENEKTFWEILHKNPPIDNDTVSVHMQHFSEFNLIEYKKLVIDYSKSEIEQKKDEEEIKKEVMKSNSELLDKAKNRECSVVFMAMLKNLSDTNNGEVVVECTRKKQLHKRLQHWKNEGYKDQKPSYTTEFIILPKQEFKINIVGSALKEKQTLSKLQYHPKRQNVFKLPVIVDDNKDGYVDIAKKEEEDVQKEFEDNPNYKTLAQILLHFIQIHKSEDNENVEEEKTSEGFTNEKLLKDLAQDLGSEWQRVAVQLGFSETSLKMKDEEETVENQRYRLLKSWRDSRLHRNDHGVPELLIALQKGGRTDLVQKIMKRLEEWFGKNKMQEDRFCSWLKVTLNGSSATKKELPKPMSDEFIAQLVEKTGVIFDLARELDVSKPELELILIDPLSSTPESKMIKLYMTSRDKQISDDRAFQVVVEALSKFYLEEPRNWMLQTARSWENTVEKSHHPFVQNISDYLDEAEPYFMPGPGDDEAL